MKLQQELRDLESEEREREKEEADRIEKKKEEVEVKNKQSQKGHGKNNKNSSGNRKVVDSATGGIEEDVSVKGEEDAQSREANEEGISVSHLSVTYS